MARASASGWEGVAAQLNRLRGSAGLSLILQIPPNPWMMAHFAVLLAAIAMAPLFFADWWSRHFGKVTFALAALTLAYYLVGLHAVPRVLYTAGEYTSFICLVGALFVISGGIHINVKGEATSRANVLFLLVGALVANILGTTGASMLIIRPGRNLDDHTVSQHVVSYGSPALLTTESVPSCSPRLRETGCRIAA
jgi:hypothetical protein